MHCNHLQCTCIQRVYTQTILWHHRNSRSLWPTSYPDLVASATVGQETRWAYSTNPEYHRVGHGLDPSMDWIGLGPEKMDPCPTLEHRRGYRAATSVRAADVAAFQQNGRYRRSVGRWLVRRRAVHAARWCRRWLVRSLGQSVRWLIDELSGERRRQFRRWRCPRRLRRPQPPNSKTYYCVLLPPRRLFRRSYVCVSREIEITVTARRSVTTELSRACAQSQFVPSFFLSFRRPAYSQW